MGCSKNSGPSGLHRKKTGEPLYTHPAPPGFRPLQAEPDAVFERVCIKAEKIYERCKIVETNEEIADLCGIAQGNIEDVWCVDVELVVDKHHPFKCEKIAGTNRAKTSFWFRYRFCYVDQSGQKFFTSEPVFFTKTVIMSNQICDERLFVQCEVFLDCFECFVSGPQQVTCCIGKMIIFSLVARVDLMIPAYGFCYEPDDCTEVEAECPEFEPGWPPFPPQPICPSEDEPEPEPEP